MRYTLNSLADLADLDADDIIDVRAPAEFAEDHIPGAINLAVLTDTERAEVGTLYTQVNRFQARKVGAALVARNAARHLQGPLADRPGGWRPLVYCWRGGQRSGSFASILEQIGWRVRVLDGGYRSYRRQVVRVVHDTPLAHRLVLLDGNTGTAKTELLARLSARGVQVLDLEALASHRGSVFGHMGQQPSQKAFEGALAMALTGLDPDHPVVVEAESSRIGEVSVPPSLWAAMRDAPRIRIEAPLAARAHYLLQAYSDVIEDRTRLLATLASLRPLQGAGVIDRWTDMATSGAFAPLAEELMQLHYDPRYAKSARRIAQPAAVIATPSLDPAAQERCADQIAETVARAVLPLSDQP